MAASVAGPKMPSQLLRFRSCCNFFTASPRLPFLIVSIFVFDFKFFFESFSYSFGFLFDVSYDDGFDDFCRRECDVDVFEM